MKTALDLINSSSPIPYVKDFLTQGEADSLFAALQALTPVREKNKKNANTFIRMLRYGTYVLDPASRTKTVYGPKLDILTAPAEIQALRAKLSAYAGKDVNYISVLGYADQYDHINPHQHKEDHVEKDASVLVVSLGHIRELVLRPLGSKDREQYETIMPEHGSLYTLPHEYNTTHEHSIPDSKFRCGLRISINCKHEAAPAPKKRKCDVEGCKKPAFGTHRPAHNITSNGKCHEHGGAETWITNKKNLVKNRNAGISWTHDTWNPWMGCDKVSEECHHCYILAVLRKLGLKAWGEVVRAKSTWGKSVRWEKELAGTNQYMRMFTCSLSDFFHKKADPWRDEAWEIIKNTPHCVYLILTKRPERIAKHLPADWGEGYKNVWLGTSIGSNKQVHRADVLRKVPAAVRFLSCEPLIEDIADKLDITGLQWIIAGGESGSGEEYRYDPKVDWRKQDGTTGRRTMDLSWAYKLYIKANDAGVPFFFKQITSARSGVGADKLTGKEIHEFPAPPAGGVWWTEPVEELVQIKAAGGKS